MADLEKVIKGLECCDKKYPRNAWCKYCPYEPDCCHDSTCDILIHDAMKLLQQFRWIPVSERLPEYTGTYLVRVGVNQVGEGMHMECRTAMFYYPSKMFYVHKEVQDEMLGGVVKWMPTPPEGGKQDG